METLLDHVMLSIGLSVSLYPNMIPHVVSPVTVGQAAASPIFSVREMWDSLEESVPPRPKARALAPKTSRKADTPPSFLVIQTYARSDGNRVDTVYGLRVLCIRSTLA